MRIVLPGPFAPPPSDRRLASHAGKASAELELEVSDVRNETAFDDVPVGAESHTNSIEEATMARFSFSPAEACCADRERATGTRLRPGSISSSGPDRLREVGRDRAALVFV